nr:hypothetical protein [Bilophila wadsworthia]
MSALSTLSVAISATVRLYWSTLIGMTSTFCPGCTRASRWSRDCGPPFCSSSGASMP